jgi:serine/threonine protein kinase
VADGTVNNAENEVEVSDLCPVCHKPIVGQSRASITGWLFATNRCQCRINVPRNDQPEDSEKPALHLKQKADGPEPEFGQRYTYLGLIGSGGMGTVYKVRDKFDNGLYAIKVVARDVAQDDVKVKRFIQEADAVSNLDHPNIATVYSHGECLDGTPYLLMEYVEGKSLAELLSTQLGIEVDTALDIFIQILEALEHAHSKGIIHRDIKPSNIVISKVAEPEMLVKLVDFGIARVVNESAREATNLTHSGDVFGSPPYMSPEQCLGYQCDSRSDIYSLGCVMHETLTGQVPFAEINAIQTIIQHLNSEPRALISTPWRHFPPALNNVLSKALAKDPGNRYQSALEMRQDLEFIKEGKKPKFTLVRKRLPAAVMYLPLIMAINLAIFVGIFQEYTTVLEAPVRAGTIISQANALSKDLYDAGSAMGGYGITQSPVFIDHYNSLMQEIPDRVSDLKESIGNRPKQQESLKNVERLTDALMQILSDSKKAMEESGPDVSQYHARHMYRDLRTTSDQLQQELSTLTQEENKIKVDKNYSLHAKSIVFAEALALFLSDLGIIWFVLMRQNKLSRRRIWQVH